MRILASVMVSLIAFPFLAYVYFGFGLAASAAVDDLGQWWWQVIFYSAIVGLAIFDAYLGIWTYRCLDRRCHR